VYFSQDCSNELLAPTRSRVFPSRQVSFFTVRRKKKKVRVTIARLGIAQCVDYRQLFEIRAIIACRTHIIKKIAIENLRTCRNLWMLKPVDAIFLSSENVATSLKLYNPIEIGNYSETAKRLEI